MRARARGWAGPPALPSRAALREGRAASADPRSEANGAERSAPPPDPWPGADADRVVEEWIAGTRASEGVHGTRSGAHDARVQSHSLSSGAASEQTVGHVAPGGDGRTCDAGHAG
eukprot:673402-Alexandrium_andersonii.AAC.1